MKEVKTIWGKKLDAKNIKKRIKKYLFESLIFSILMTVIDAFGILISKNKAVFYFFDNYVINFTLTVFITFIILFMMAFSFNYLISERQIKKTKI